VQALVLVLGLASLLLALLLQRSSQLHPNSRVRE
jgi:hypothetical protein